MSPCTGLWDERRRPVRARRVARRRHLRRRQGERDEPRLLPRARGGARPRGNRASGGAPLHGPPRGLLGRPRREAAADAGPRGSRGDAARLRAHAAPSLHASAADGGRGERARHCGRGAARLRLQLNEVAIGLTLPTWAIVLACAAIPPRWHTEAILHARAYAPEEALAREIVDRVVPPEQLLAAAREAAAPLAALDHAAYGGSKARLRALAVRWATDRLAEESRGALPLGRPDRG